MRSLSKLSSLDIGKYASVVKLKTQGAMRRRLLDIGLIKGTKVKCVLVSPSKNPKAFQIRGAVIALRNEDSSNILIEFEED